MNEDIRMPIKFSTTKISYDTTNLLLNKVFTKAQQ